MPHVTVAVLWKAYTDTDALGCDVRTEVEAPLDIKDAIHHISCFSKTTVMSISLPSVGRTSALSMTYDRWL